MGGAQPSRRILFVHEAPNTSITPRLKPGLVEAALQALIDYPQWLWQVYGYCRETTTLPKNGSDPK